MTKKIFYISTLFSSLASFFVCSLIPALFFAIILVTPAKSLATAFDDTSTEYEEVSYDDLLGRISNKKSYLKKESVSPFDDVLIHVGLGYVSSFSRTSIPENQLSNQLSGLQLSLGINLFSPRWYSEANWRNFGVYSRFAQEISLRELDFRIGFQDELSAKWKYRLSTGLATRFLHFSDAQKSISMDTTTPAMIVSFGIFASLSDYVSLGAETSMRSPLVSSTDKGSWDLSLQTLTSF